MATALTKNDPAGKIKVAGLVKGLANTMKNNQGKVDGMKKTHFLQKKIAYEKDFMIWVNADPARKAKYGNLLADEKKEYEVIRKTKDRDNVLGVVQGLAGMQLGVAGQIVFLAMELDKPESERQPGLTPEAIDEAADGLKYTYANYVDYFDKALLVRALEMADALPSGQRIQPMEYIFSDPSVTPAQWAEKAMQQSKLNDLEFARSLFRKSASELKALNDPFIDLAFKLYPLLEETQEVSRVFGANVTEIRKHYLEGLFEWKGTGMYPDANGTMRFTWGKVKGYKPRNAVWYDPFTTLEGVVEKNTGVEPFNAPADLVNLYEKRDFGNYADPVLKDVPVAFLSQCDITGGNSGSPIMNAKGEIAGLVFDGNYEAMIGDWQYDYALQRTISVDIRYVLWVTEKIGKAEFILEEMRKEK